MNNPHDDLYDDNQVNIESMSCVSSLNKKEELDESQTSTRKSIEAIPRETIKKLQRYVDASTRAQQLLRAQADTLSQTCNDPCSDFDITDQKLMVQDSNCPHDNKTNIKYSNDSCNVLNTVCGSCSTSANSQLYAELEALKKKFNQFKQRNAA